VTGDPDPAGSAKLAAARYRIETVNGQLAGRFRAKRTWARDVWHLEHRVTRKVLGHTVMAYAAVAHGHTPLTFDRLEEAA
jgi:hypothetical protein